MANEYSINLKAILNLDQVKQQIEQLRQSKGNFLGTDKNNLTGTGNLNNLNGLGSTLNRLNQSIIKLTNLLTKNNIGTARNIQSLNVAGINRQIGMSTSAQVASNLASLGGLSNIISDIRNNATGNVFNNNPKIPLASLKSQLETLKQNTQNVLNYQSLTNVDKIIKSKYFSQFVNNFDKHSNNFNQKFYEQYVKRNGFNIPNNKDISNFIKNASQDNEAWNMLQELANNKKLRKKTSRLLESTKLQKFAGVASAVGLSVPMLLEQGSMIAEAYGNKGLSTFLKGGSTIAGSTAMGAMMGSIIPGFGTLAGAGVGFVVGGVQVGLEQWLNHINKENTAREKLRNVRTIIGEYFDTKNSNESFNNILKNSLSDTSLLDVEIQDRKNKLKKEEDILHYINEEGAQLHLLPTTQKNIANLNKEITLLENQKANNKNRIDSVNEYITAQKNIDKNSKTIKDLQELVNSGNFDDVISQFNSFSDTINTLKNTRSNLLNKKGSYNVIDKEKTRDEIEKLNSEISENTAYRDILKNSLLANLQGQLTSLKAPSMENVNSLAGIGQMINKADDNTRSKQIMDYQKEQTEIQRKIKNLLENDGITSTIG